MFLKITQTPLYTTIVSCKCLQWFRSHQLRTVPKVMLVLWNIEHIWEITLRFLREMSYSKQHQSFVLNLSKKNHTFSVPILNFWNTTSHKDKIVGGQTYTQGITLDTHINSHRLTMATWRLWQPGRYFLLGFLRTSDDKDKFPVRMMTISDI